MGLSKVILHKRAKEKPDFSIIIENESTINSVYTFIYFKDKFYLSDKSYNAMIKTLHLDTFFTMHQIVIDGVMAHTSHNSQPSARSAAAAKRSARA